MAGRKGAQRDASAWGTDPPADPREHLPKVPLDLASQIGSEALATLCYRAKRGDRESASFLCTFCFGGVEDPLAPTRLERRAARMTEAENAADLMRCYVDAGF